MSTNNGSYLQKRMERVESGAVATDFRVQREMEDRVLSEEQEKKRPRYLKKDTVVVERVDRT